MNLFYAFLHIIGIPILKALFRLEVKGRENIPDKGGVILASNHASYLDPIVVATASPRQLYFLAKEDLFKVKFLSWVVRRLNALPVLREKVQIATTRKSIEILKKGEILLLFPEGTRTATGEISEGKRGVGLIAKSTGVPVIPVLIEGSGEALPKDKRWISSHKVWVTFGRPLYPETIKVKGKKKEIYQTTSDRIMEEIRKLSDS